MYDYLIIGSGLFGITFARTVVEAGKTALVLERRSQVGGNVHSRSIEGIDVHTFGPHIFHTNNQDIWDYVNKFTPFRPYVHTAKSLSNGKVYSLPFNMNTFHQLWGCVTPAEAIAELERQKVKIESPSNLEEQALSTVGQEIYDKLIYGYTKKQWCREPRTLPASIIKRLPIRFTYNDNYYNDIYQGIPVKGYSDLILNMVDGLDVHLNADFSDVQNWRSLARNLVYSGPIDRFFNYQHGYLAYRSLRFELKTMDGDFQGCAVMNRADLDVPYTRTTEFKHFQGLHCPKTVVAYEYSQEWTPEQEPFYPINDEENAARYELYVQEARKVEGLIVGGRLGKYAYWDMHVCIANARSMANKSLNSQ